MAIDVRTRFKTTLPGGGYTATGAASNRKGIVVGDIDVTTYTAQGEPVTPADLGLDTIDTILLSVVNVDGSLPTATNIHVVTYDYTAEQILAWDGTAFADVPNTSIRVRFAAFGDLQTPELI